MKHWMKRSLALLLCLVMICAALPAAEVSAEEIELVPVDDETVPADEDIVILDAEELEAEEDPAPVGNADTPTIVTQPKSKKTCVGYGVSFYVKAENATKYQWYYRSSSSASWTKVPEDTATKSTLKYSAVSIDLNGYQYRCKVSNSAGYLYTKTVTLTVTIAPAITTQPKSKTVEVGSTAKFTVKATGALSYQWYYRTSKNGAWHQASLTGNKTATLSVYGKSSRNGYQYRCLVANGQAYVYTNTVTLTVTDSGKPTITTQPSSVTATPGATAKFTVKASKATSYQWYYRTSSSGSWTKTTLTGATTSTLSVYAKTTRNGYQYRCKVSNSNGYVYSNTVKLTVKKPTGDKPTITSQPSSVTATAGATAKFTVKASNATKYQWYYRTSSSGSWHQCTSSGSTSSSFSIYAKTTRNGYYYRCKVSNSNGYVYSNAVKLTVKKPTGDKPTITTQPKSVTKYQDYTAKFTVKASNATKYQWYYRTSSSGSWNKCTSSSATSSTFSIKAKSSRSGYQYRCKVSNSNGYVYSNTVTLKVNKVTYRALLVGEVNFWWDNPVRNRGDVEMMSDLLSGISTPKGGKYSVTCKYDLSNAGLRNAISSTFANADGNDVSLFFIATHGDSDSYGTDAGKLCLISEDGYDDEMTMQELAACLKNVPGKVIVLLGSCGSGAAIVNDGTVSYVDSADLFNEAAIRAFAEADEFLPVDEDEALSNTGELRESKFYVMTAAAYLENSVGGSSFNVFTYYIAEGAGSGKPADANGNGTITLSELYDYVYPRALGPWTLSDGTTMEQHCKVYPENSTYALFK